MATEKMNEAGGTTPLPQGGLSQVARVVDTFVAPSKTFEDIRRNASWWLPFLLMVVFTAFSTYAVQTQVGWDRVAENQIQASPRAQDQMSQLEPAKKAQAMDRQAAVVKYVSYGAPVGLVIFFLLYALILWGSFNFGLGAQTTFSQVLAVTWYAALPYCLLSVITFVTLHFGNAADSYDVKNPIGTNLGFYLTSAPPMVRAVLSALDVIKLWSVVLQVIGMAIVARKTIAQSAVVVGIFWVLGVLAGVVGAAFS